MVLDEFIRQECGLHGSSPSSVVSDRWYRRYHRDQQAPMLPSRSTGIDSSAAVSKLLPHSTSFVENEGDGCSVDNDGTSCTHQRSIWWVGDGIFEPRGYDDGNGDSHDGLVHGDAVGGGWIVLIWRRQRRLSSPWLFACFHREIKYVPKFWYKIYEFLP
jgi:hypothetical protein